MDIVIEGHFTPADKAAGDYRLLAFPVSEGTQRIEVRYTFDRDAGNILDLGLFDPRGAGFLHAEGFRGWSGSDRDHVIVTARCATPGYLPGPLFPGTWHVILGLYKVQPKGCSYRVEITLSEAEGEPPGPIPSTEVPVLTPRSGPAWFKGDLQSHTHHSDGRASVAELAAVARGRGLNFLAVTDHNTVSHHPELAIYSGPDLLLIPGQEVTTYYGHANVWGPSRAGLDRWLDFRGRTDEDMRLIITEAHNRGLLFSVNHPKDTGTPWTYSFDLPFDCMEVWQGLWPWLNHESLAYWERLLMKGRRVIAVGGSDKHQGRPGDDPGLNQLGQPTTWVYATALTTEAVLAGIRAGHAFISADVDGPQLLLTARTSRRARLLPGIPKDENSLAPQRCHSFAEAQDKSERSEESPYASQETLHFVQGDRSGQEGYFHSSEAEATMGDELTVGPDQPVSLRCEVTGGAGRRLRLLSGGRALAQVDMPRDHFVWETELSLSAPGYVRAELVAEAHNLASPDPQSTQVFALTNPVYLTPKLKNADHSDGADQQPLSPIRASEQSGFSPPNRDMNRERKA